MDDALSLSYAETEALVRVLHDVGESGEKALLARFKYFQRMDFPHRAKVGRGSRVGYSFEDVLLLVLAFQLMELGTAPTRIVGALMPNWRELRSVLWRAHLGLSNDEGEPAEALVLVPDALSELRSGDDGPGIAEKLRPIPRTDLARWLSSLMGGIELRPGHRLDEADRRCVQVVIDPVRLVRLVLSVLPRVSRVTRSELDEAFRRLAG